MSRIGYTPIQVPQGVEVNIEGSQVYVKGPKGESSAPLFDGINIKEDSGLLHVDRADHSQEMRRKHGLVRSLLANCVHGTSQGFTKTLILQGVGYRAVKKGSQLVLTLGYSHDVTVDTPENLSVEVPEPTKVQITGIEKQQVGDFAARLKGYRPPEPYKGKGISYEGEKIRRKVGKAGKKK